MSETPTLRFLGAAGTVTGSKYLVSSNGRRVLLDCGLFQGLKELRQRNWSKPPFEAGHVDAVVLSHAHIDHSGYLSLLVRHGFRGPVFCTPGTADLLGVLLPDAAHLQEEEAAAANRYGNAKHRPALPLYTVQDAQAALRLIESRSCGDRFAVTAGLAAIFRRAGHILGSASVELQIGGDDPFRLVFSGDLGRWGRPILRDPEPVPEADALLVESTYGDRTHPPASLESLAQIVRETAQRGGALLVPAFAVGRTQELIWMLRQLEEANRIPSLPVYIDSPMAINVSDIYCRHPEDHALDMKLLMDEKRCPLCCKQYRLALTAKLSLGDALAEGHRLLLHPLAFAGWLGLLVTALNLLPIGQLDGGHLADAMFGRARSAAIGTAALVALVLLSLFVWSGLLTWALIVYFIAGGKGLPPLNDVSRMGVRRQAIGALAFILLFLILAPVPHALYNALGIHCPYL
jgi:metallo-beta-lactamase family protein